MIKYINKIKTTVDPTAIEDEIIEIKYKLNEIINNLNRVTDKLNKNDKS